MRKILFYGLAFLLAACQTTDFAEPGALVPLTADQDPAVPSLSVNGTLLHVESYGQAADPLVVVIHGGPGGDFRSMLSARVLADSGFRVVFYDQRGSGLSERRDKQEYESAEGISLFLEDLHQLIGHFRVSPSQKVFLLGHSWGAMLATGYINRHPGVVSGAILAEPGGLTWTQTNDYLSRSNKIRFFSEALNNSVFPEQIIAGRSEHEVLDYKASFFSNYENAPGNVIGNPGEYPSWRNGAVAFQYMIAHADKYNFDFTTHLSQFTPEVLFLYSQNNRAYGKSWAETVSKPFPKVKMDMVKDCGHEMLFFGWTDMYPKVLNYLTSRK